MNSENPIEFQKPAPNYLAVCTDLFFTSKVTSTAQMLGFNCTSAMSMPKALSEIEEMEDLRGIVLDLMVPGLDLEEFMSKVPEAVKPHTIAFGPHVEKATLELALELGCAAVFPRSRFTAQLPALLQQYFTPIDSDESE